MTSRVELDIEGGQSELAQLFADPRNTPAWMDEVARIEPISGAPGQFGSVYRIVPKPHSWEFVATVVKRALPAELGLLLKGPHVNVDVKDSFIGLSESRTKLISEEVFTFDSFFRTALGWLAFGLIKREHRYHLEAFKRFAESRVSSAAS
jgi:hypothetical protein